MHRDDSLRVVTFNVYGPANPDWERRHALIRSTLHELDADVVALQEVPVDPAFLEDLVGRGYHFGSFAPGPGDDVAGTLATRWPQRRVVELDLRITERSRATLAWCAALVVELDTPVGTVVVAHHKPSWPFPFELEREAQAVLLARTLEEHIGDRDVHAVVLGDFDATPDSASLSFLRGRRPVDGLSVCYQDAWEYLHPDHPGRTFDLEPLVREGEVATAVSRRIDHVLVGGHARPHPSGTRLPTDPRHPRRRGVGERPLRGAGGPRASRTATGVPQHGLRSRRSGLIR